MQKLTDVRLVKIIEEKTRTAEPQPYNLLQVLISSAGVRLLLGGEVVDARRATYEGADCQALKILGNGGKYMKTYRVIDFDLEKKYSVGKPAEITAFPVVKIRDGKPFLIYEAVTESREEEHEGEPYLLPIKDFSGSQWRPGVVSIPVALTPWGPSERGNVGVNYRVEG